MELRPDFNKIKSYDEFSKYYWYRIELSKICRKLGISVFGKMKVSQKVSKKLAPQMA